MRRLKAKSSVIGLDIGRTSIKAVQIGLGDKGPSLESGVRVSRRSSGGAIDFDEARHLLRTMERMGMTANRVVLVAPTDALVGGSMAVPPADKGVSRDKLVGMELSRTYKLSPGRFEMAWWDLPTPASGSRIGQVHAVGLPHAAVEGTLAVLGELGLQVCRTVPGSLALIAAAQRHPVDPRCIAAVVDLGSTRGHLVLMTAGRVVHERALPDFNMKQLESQVSEVVGNDARLPRHAILEYGAVDRPQGRIACETSGIVAEAIHPLAEEIGMSFAYVSHLYPEAELGHLLLSGGCASIAGLGDALQNELELETALVSPSGLLAGERFGDDLHDPSLTMAMGAALCGEVVR